MCCVFRATRDRVTTLLLKVRYFHTVFLANVVEFIQCKVSVLEKVQICYGNITESHKNYWYVANI